MSAKTYLVSQFGNPRGPVGALVGAAMAVKNRRRIAWAMEVLDPQPEDRVLEIGFGPGVSIREIAARVPRGHVSGIERSALMVKQAERRLRREIRDGRVDLRQGSVSWLPHEEAVFDRALAVNTLMFWPDPVANLTEIRRVLRPGGRLAVVTQPHFARTEKAFRAVCERVQKQVRDAGFDAVELLVHPMTPVACLGVRGTKP